MVQTPRARGLRDARRAAPPWLVLTLLAVVLALLGLAGLGDLLLWAAAVLLLGIVVTTAVGLRRKSLATGAPAPGAAGGTWDRRAARLGWVALALTALTFVLLGVGAWVVVRGQARIVPSSPRRPGEAVLPVDVTLTAPDPGAVLALGLGLAAFLVGMAALQAATAMRVLARGRGLSAPPSAAVATAGRRTLGAVATRTLRLEELPAWPASAIPAGADGVRRLRCTVLIPAHDEEAVLGRTLASLGRQSRRPDRVVVVADNCTDATVRIARERGAEVVETVGNDEHKAGALNQVLAVLLPDTDVHDVVLVMDADSSVTPDFLKTAVGRLEDDPDLMAVGGLFSGEDGEGLLGQMQRNEFARYQRVISRREGQVFVLTGTASVFRAFALRAVAQSRGTLVPGITGDVYDTRAMTEDNELTLALKSLGAASTSPGRCRVTTEVMPTWSALWRQRLRWQRGAIENVGAYGFTRTTARYWGQQVALGYGVLALHAYLVLTAVALLASDEVRWSPFWLAVGAVFLVERIVTAWAAGWRGRAVAAPLVLELAYAVALQWTFLTSLVQIATRERAGWNYVPRPATSALVVPVVLAAAVLPAWSPLPSTALQSTWFAALSLFVGVNTLVFAALSLFQLLPPLRRTYRRVVRSAAPTTPRAADEP